MDTLVLLSTSRGKCPVSHKKDNIFVDLKKKSSRGSPLLCLVCCELLQKGREWVLVFQVVLMHQLASPHVFFFLSIVLV